MNFKSLRGFALIAIAVAIVILGAMAAMLATLVATNNMSQVAQQNTDQDFYLSHAALEHALYQISVPKVLNVPPRQLLGQNLAPTRLTEKIQASTNYGSGNYVASNANSIRDIALRTGSGCMFVLDPSASGALTIGGGGSLNMSACGAYVDSISSSAVSVVGGASMSTTFLNIGGNYSAGPGAITTTLGITTNSKLVADPLLAYDVPSYSTCDHTNFSASGNKTLDPGVYCGGISLAGNKTITLNPGNYIIDGGTFSITGGPTVNGSGVTIFLTKKLQSSYATLSVGGNGTTTLTAPATGPYAGILIFQSRNAPSSGTNTIAGTSNSVFNGVVYTPAQLITFGGGNSGSAPCTMIVAGKVTISGSTYISCSTGALAGLVL